MSRKKGAGPNWCHFCQKKLQLRPGSQGGYYFTELLTPHDRYLVRTHNACVENALRDGYTDPKVVKAKMDATLTPPKPHENVVREAPPPERPVSAPQADSMSKDEVIAVLNEARGEQGVLKWSESLGITHTMWWRAIHQSRLPKRVIEALGLREEVRYVMKDKQ